jgi:hypothetical protein
MKSLRTTIFFSSFGEIPLSFSSPWTESDAVVVAALVSAALALEREGETFQNPGGEFCSAAALAACRVARES